jgi:hypothetical protein
MTVEKGLDPATADKIGEYVKHKGIFSFPPPKYFLTIGAVKVVRHYSNNSEQTRPSWLILALKLALRR